MTGQLIRQASTADWPALWPIWHEIVAAADTYCYEPSTTMSHACAKWLGAPSSEVWALWAGDQRSGDEPIGMYWLGPNQDGPGAHVANASYMVSAAARGKGVGRRLVEHSLARAAGRGFRAIQFNAVAATNVHAIELYERLGFATVGRVPGAFRHPVEGYVDLLVMHRTLA